MSLSNGHGASYTGLWRTVLAGLILAAAVGVWEASRQLSRIDARLEVMETSFQKMDERLTWLERRERRR